MDLIPPRKILALGYNLRALRGVAPGEQIGGKNNLLDILQGTATTLEQLEFTVSSEIFQARLRRFRAVRGMTAFRLAAKKQGSDYALVMAT